MSANNSLYPEEHVWSDPAAALIALAPLAPIGLQPLMKQAASRISELEQQAAIDRDFIMQYERERNSPEPDTRQPDGYAYRYETYRGTVIHMSNGEEINGFKPIETIPYYFGKPVSETEKRYGFDRPRNRTKDDERLAAISKGPATSEPYAAGYADGIARYPSRESDYSSNETIDTQPIAPMDEREDPCHPDFVAAIETENPKNTDADRFVFWFNPAAKTVDINAYMEGIKSGWSLDEWRVFVDAQMRKQVETRDGHA